MNCSVQQLHDALALVPGQALMLQVSQDGRRLRLIHNPQMMLRRQIIYYFSDNNWPRDLYMQMMAETNGGAIPISELLKFRRVAALMQQYFGNDDHDGGSGGVDSTSHDLDAGGSADLDQVCNWNSSLMILLSQ